MVNFVVVSAAETAPVDIPDSGPARLDHFVRQRINKMRISHYELARRGGPNRTTLHKAVNGAGRLRESTLARLDLTLGWAPGSSAGVLAGGIPQTRIVTGPDDEHVVTVLRAATTMVVEASKLMTTVHSLLRDLIGHDEAADGEQ
jgi:hypothetical protein